MLKKRNIPSLPSSFVIHFWLFLFYFQQCSSVHLTACLHEIARPLLIVPIIYTILYMYCIVYNVYTLQEQTSIQPTQKYFSRLHFTGSAGHCFSFSHCSKFKHWWWWPIIFFLWQLVKMYRLEEKNVHVVHYWFASNLKNIYFFSRILTMVQQITCSCICTCI